MKILRLDMRTGNSSYEDADETYPMLGGRGLIAALLLKEIDPACDPLGDDNKLVICNGLMAGTLAATSGRLSLGGKSPLSRRRTPGGPPVLPWPSWDCVPLWSPAVPTVCGSWSSARTMSAWMMPRGWPCRGHTGPASSCAAATGRASPSSVSVLPESGGTSTPRCRSRTGRGIPHGQRPGAVWGPSWAAGGSRPSFSWRGTSVPP